MSPRVALLLETEGVRVLGVPGAPWIRFPDPRNVADALRGVVPRGADALLVVGTGVLEAAEPTLPPVPAAVRLPLVRRESDRFLPFPPGAAVALAGPLALGMDGRALEGWVSAIEEALPVRAVVSLPQCVAWAGADGHWSCPAPAGETAEVTVRNGALVEVRRHRSGPDAEARGVPPRLDVDAIVETVRRRRRPRRRDQLLTPALDQRLAQRQRRAWWGSAAWAACALVALTAGVERQRARELAALEARERTLVEALEPARIAQARADRARQELDALDALAAAAEAPTAPLRVLATLGEALPPEAFLQRLEWDGQTWRLDGSARDAAVLVPRLAAHPGFREVRTVAPSQQFMDNGVARRSFAITLRTVDRARTAGAADPGSSGRDGRGEGRDGPR
jgi:hypothetical protein